MKSLTMAILSVCCISVKSQQTVWTDVRTLQIRGRAFDVDELGSWADRLPAKAEGVVRGPVWSLSRDSAGMYVDFITDSRNITLNTTYVNNPGTMYHFSASGINGLDLFQWDAPNSTWRWVGTTKNQADRTEIQPILNRPETPSVQHKYRLHFPLYNGVLKLSIGTDKGATISPAPVQYEQPPVIWYGTSITQGGVVSRPGFAFTNNIMRNIGREIFNFGFSGNCLMEIDVAQYLVTVKPTPALFIIDCEWNMNPQMVAERTIPLVNFIRAKLPNTPIVLVEGTPGGDAWINSASIARQSSMWSTLREQYDILLKNTSQLHYVTGPGLYEKAGGPAVNPTVAGTHPSDLGQASMTDFYTKYLPTILKNNDVNKTVGEANTKLGKVKETTELERRYHNEILLEMVEATSIPISATTTYYNVESTVGVMGRAFNGTERWYNRLPLSAKQAVPEGVYNAAVRSAGMSVHFVTNSSSVAVNFTFQDKVVPRWDMPDTAASGLDLYRYDPSGKAFRSVRCATSWPSSTPVVIDENLPVGSAERYVLYLPVLNEVTKLSIGVDSGSVFEVDTDFNTVDSITAYGKKPILWLGTGTEQGFAVSRPGNVFTSILSRNLQRYVLNFGFETAKMDVSVAGYAAQIDADLIVIDCLADMTPEEISEQTSPYVKYLRAHGHPTTPILLVAGTVYGDYWLNPGPNTDKRDALQQQFESLSHSDPNVHVFLNEHNQLFSSDWMVNPTVGGADPSDLGHREMAKFYTAFLPQFF
eukprot:TRINITY_DN3144_c2_g1_i2.p1 TRINITY_DN3144_c2_g1~~TRINITY_DN3144_c2_g1_i2.p1  ORF type:complete len:759 (+),score=91.34 TRINITY_DN3144_c2_g1_i2:192-2468(+)